MAGEPYIASVCQVRGQNGFTQYHGDLVYVRGEIEANAEFSILYGPECDKGLLLQTEVEKLKSLIASKIGCSDDRPLRVVVRGNFDKKSTDHGLFYVFDAVELVSAEFHDGRSTACVTTAPHAPRSADLFPQMIEFDGRVVAFDWAVFPGFENITIEHFVVKVEHTSNKQELPHYIRVDFWGVQGSAEYRLPDSIFESGHRSHWQVVAPSVASVATETCEPVDETITNVDSAGRLIEKIPAFRALENATDVPSFSSLKCYEVQRQGVSVLQ